MGAVLIAWELGAGFGHIGHLIPVAQALIQRGHRAVAALSNVTRGGPPLQNVGVEVHPCPVEQYRAANPIFPTRSFAHVLHDTGFESESVLHSRVAAWLGFVDRIQPDIVVCDHSPTTLLALRGTGIKKALLGTGYFCPPPSAFDEWPVPRPPIRHDHIRGDSEKVLANASGVLRRLGVTPLTSLPQLFSEVDEVFLITVEELDHFPGRSSATYRGILRAVIGERAEWPAPRVFRVFAYLKDFPVLGHLMRALRDGPFSSLVFTDSVPERVLASAAADNLRLLSRPADMVQIGRECDVGITNANHGTICDLLLAGKPALMIPLTSEQYLLARRVEENGLGLLAAANDIDAIRYSLVRLLEENSFRQAAAEFQRRYSHVRSEMIAVDIAQRIERLLSA
jgi:UDP:flavonoid glycosyltransferase YjiC (YdhE family)